MFTALYGFGRGLAIVDESGEATGGFTRRLTFGEVNGGVNWVGDDGARERWGRWDAARGEKVHAFGQVTFPQCERPEQLLALTRSALAEAVVDSSRSPEWRLTARVARRVRELAAGACRCRVTLGTVERATWAAAADTAARVVAVEETAAAASDRVAAMDEIDLGEMGF